MEGVSKLNPLALHRCSPVSLESYKLAFQDPTLLLLAQSQQSGWPPSFSVSEFALLWPGACGAGSKKGDEVMQSQLSQRCLLDVRLYDKCSLHCHVGC